MRIYRKFTNSLKGLHKAQGPDKNIKMCVDSGNDLDSVGNGYPLMFYRYRIGGIVELF